MPGLDIVGAGMAGLLAGNMLHRMTPIIYERQSSIPNNHSAVLRFRSTSVGDALSIPFKKVTMIKATIGWNNPVADALAYAFKVMGQYRSDRSIVVGSTTATRWVAPPGLISLMAGMLPAQAIQLNQDYAFRASRPIISTIPMPALMALLDYPVQPKFVSRPGRNVHARIDDCDAYVSLMVPDPANPISRISITGDEAIIECGHEPFKSTEGIIASAAAMLGIPQPKFHDVTSHDQLYAKIQPIDDAQRKAFMFWATDRHGIFSLGRFATWRPGLLLDDLVQDVQKIAGWLQTDHRYDLVRNR